MTDACPIGLVLWGGLGGKGAGILQQPLSVMSLQEHISSTIC